MRSGMGKEVSPGIKAVRSRSVSLSFLPVPEVAGLFPFYRSHLLIASDQGFSLSSRWRKRTGLFSVPPTLLPFKASRKPAQAA